MDTKTQIEYYINIALKKGVEKAIEEIKKRNDPFLLDAFHDKLVEEIKTLKKINN